jgi:hypothetical protein
MDDDERFILEFGDEEPLVVDWHARRTDKEPRCGAHQWRARDRMVVLDIAKMPKDRLRNCIKFARGKDQHASRLDRLLTEYASRPLKER